MFLDRLSRRPKESLRRIINKLGVEFFTLKKFPFGINYLTDAINMSVLSNPKIIFDVGANIGQTSMHFRNAFKETEIFAFEPVRSTYEELTKNLIGANVKTFNLGFGERQATKKVFLQELSELNSLVESLNKPNDTGAAEEVQITTIDNFCENNNITRITLLKIDTEGFGLKVLSGTKTMLANAGVESILIEVGFSENDKRHDKFSEVYHVLSKYSFQLLGFYNQWIENSRLEYCNAFFVLNK